MKRGTEMKEVNKKAVNKLMGDGCGLIRGGGGGGGSDPTQSSIF